VSAAPTAGQRPANPQEALAELLAGNERFVAGERIHPNQDAEHRAAVAQAQTPFAVVFGCSDSRLAAEIIFDRGLGDLFVVRTAGHTVGPEVLGSIEYAVTLLEVPLVVVLGHNLCGAVQAAREALVEGVRPGGHLGAIVESIAPSVRLAGPRGTDPGAIVRAHIDRTAGQVRRYLATLDLPPGRHAVVGMAYDLSAGRVKVVSPERS
jgi:carbonic anhydrase